MKKLFKKIGVASIGMVMFFWVFHNAGMLSANENEAAVAKEEELINEPPVEAVEEPEQTEVEQEKVEDSTKIDTLGMVNLVQQEAIIATPASTIIDVYNFNDFKTALSSGASDINVRIVNDFSLSNTITIAPTTKTISITSTQDVVLTKNSTVDYVFMIRSDLDFSFAPTITLDTNNSNGMFSIYGTLSGDGVVLRNVVLKNSAAKSAIYHTNPNLNLTIIDSYFDHNYTSGSGGSINFNGALLTIVDSQFYHGYANHGGAISIEKGSRLSFQDSRIEQCEAKVNGGGIYAKDETTVSIVSGILSNNKAINGGAIHANSGTSGGVVVLGTNDSKPILNNNVADEGAKLNGYYNGFAGAVFAKEVKIYDAELNNNVATANGGAIYASLFSMDNGEIANNNAYKGGGVFAGAVLSNSNVNVIINGGTIASNTATSAVASQLGGGGLTLGDPTDSSKAQLTMNGGEIIDNVAYANGGGIAVTYYADVVIKDAIINNNKVTGTLTNVANSLAGGGVYFRSDGRKTTAVFNNTSLQDNVAEGNGGAIYFEIGDLNIEGNTRISNNTSMAKNGGGIYTNSIHFKNGLVEFNEAALDGGGIYLYGNATTSEFEEGILQQNSATNGGAVYSKAPIEIDGTIQFLANVATANGGAIYSASALSVDHNAKFANNFASAYGGGIYTNSIHFKNGLVEFNEAGLDGGGIYLYGDATTSKFEEGILQQNSATNGGAVYSKAPIEIDGTIQFLTNVAMVSGGAIYSIDAMLVDQNAEFANNFASDNGGALYFNFKNGKTANIVEAQFHDNESLKDGGAIYTASMTDSNPITGLKALYIQEKTSFYKNQASVSYNWFADESASDPDSISAIYISHVFTSQCTEPFFNVYNNMDTGFGLRPLQVTFDFNSPTDVMENINVHVYPNEKVNWQSVQALSGYQFLGWCESLHTFLPHDANVNSIQYFDFDTPIVEDKILYGQWIEEKSEKSTDSEDGSKTIDKKAATAAEILTGDAIYPILSVFFLLGSLGMLYALHRKRKSRYIEED